MYVVVTDEQGKPVVWLDADGRHDTRTDRVTPLSRDETRTLVIATLVAGIGHLKTARQAATQAATAMAARASAAALVAQQESARATTVQGTAPALNLAFLGAVRDDLAATHTRLAQIAESIAASARDDAAAAAGIGLAYDALIYLAELVGRDIIEEG